MAELFRTVEDARAFVRRVRGQGRTLALVPTMGFLHEGHLSLMREGKRRADVCAATIFVNPTQFGPKEDLSRYPRDLEGDLKKCDQAGVDAVWAPERDQVYPHGYQTYVDVTELSKGLCGERRPGHFRGVATVVTKLLALFRPDVALFGEKDFQQLRVIQRLNDDLDLGAEVVGLPIVREPDGLAMGSRNSYLSAAERHRALSLQRGLRAAQALCAAGTVTARELVGAVRAELEREDGVKADYVELVDSETLAPVIRVADRPARLLVAAYVGATRLIDNLELREPSEVIRLIAEHRRARFDFKVEEKLEAGLQLTGSEVKSVRAGKVMLSDAYALPEKNGELYLHNAHIAPYGAATAFGHDPLRKRKLLMHRAEIDRWSSKVRERGYSIIPLSIYFKGAVAKVELGLCTGKTHEDRRGDIKERETQREMDRAMRRK